MRSLDRKSPAAAAVVLVRPFETGSAKAIFPPQEDRISELMPGPLLAFCLISEPSIRTLRNYRVALWMTMLFVPIYTAPVSHIQVLGRI